MSLNNLYKLRHLNKLSPNRHIFPIKQITENHYGHLFPKRKLIYFIQETKSVIAVLMLFKIQQIFEINSRKPEANCFVCNVKESPNQTV